MNGIDKKTQPLWETEKSKINERIESASLGGPARQFFRLASQRPNAAFGWEIGPRRISPSLHGANRGGFACEAALLRCVKNLGDSSGGEARAPLQFLVRGNREGPPVKRPKSFPKTERLSAGRFGRNSIQFNVPGREGNFALK